MTNFTYYTPTKVIFGKETEKEVGALVKAAGGTKALVHYGGGSVKASGLLDRVFASLKEAGVDYVELGGVKPNPHLSLVYEGIELCKKEKVDFILPVGGGSVIDSGKAIAYGIVTDLDIWDDLFCGKAVPTAIAPLGCIVTLAAAGSEMSYSSVITNRTTNQKFALNNDISRPIFAIMNPELTLTVSPYQTAVGCTDILMHTLERYFNSVHTDTMSLTDALAEALLRDVMENARILAREPDNYDARANILWSGSLAHNGLTGYGNGLGDWSVHQLGHELSVQYDTAHGASLAVMWGSWARYVYKTSPERFARLGINVLEIEPESTVEATALAAIKEMEGFFWSIDMPTSFKEAGYEPDDAMLHTMAVGCTRNGARTIGTFQVLDEADIEAIYKMARDQAE